jgi:hypothetical protein
VPLHMITDPIWNRTDFIWNVTDLIWTMSVFGSSLILFGKTYCKNQAKRIGWMSLFGNTLSRRRKNANAEQTKTNNEINVIAKSQ